MPFLRSSPSEPVPINRSERSLDNPPTNISIVTEEGSIEIDLVELFTPLIGKEANIRVIKEACLALGRPVASAAALDVWNAAYYLFQFRRYPQEDTFVVGERYEGLPAMFCGVGEYSAVRFKSNPDAEALAASTIRYIFMSEAQAAEFVEIGTGRWERLSQTEVFERMQNAFSPKYYDASGSIMWGNEVVPTEITLIGGDGSEMSVDLIELFAPFAGHGVISAEDITIYLEARGLSASDFHVHRILWAGSYLFDLSLPVTGEGYLVGERQERLPVHLGCTALPGRIYSVPRSAADRMMLNSAGGWYRLPDSAVLEDMRKCFGR